MNIMEGYADSVELYEGALDSAGVAQKKFDLYQQGTEAQLTKLKNAWSGVWQSAFDSGVINGVIGALTSLAVAIEGIVNFTGVLPVVFGSIAFAAAGLSKNFRALTIGALTLGKGFQSLGISANAAKLALRGFAASTIVGAVFVALGFALEKLVNLFFKAKESQDDYFSSLKDSVETSEETVSKIEDLNKQLKESIGTQEELNTVREQMSNLMPQIISHYDSEGKAVYKTAQEIDELIKKEKELNLERKKRLFDENSDVLSTDAKNMDSGRKDVKSNNNDFNYATAKRNALVYAQEFISKNKLDEMDTFSDEYISKMEFLQSEISRIFSENGQFATENFLAGEILSNGGIDNAVVKATKAFTSVDNAMKDANSSISEGVKKYTEHFKSFNDIVIDESGTVDKNVKVFLDNFSQAFADSNKITEDNSDSMILEYQNLSKEINQAITDNKIDITKMIESGNVDGLKKIFTDVGIGADVADKAVVEFAKSIKSVGDEVNNIKTSQQAMATLNSSYEKSAEVLSVLNGLLDDNAKGKRISAEEVVNLTQKDASLIDMFKIENGQISLNTTAINTKKEAMIEAYNKEAKATQNTLITQNSVLVEKLKLYGIEIEAIENVSAAIDTINNKTAENLNKYSSLGGEYIRATIGEGDDLKKFVTQMDNLKNQAKITGAALRTVGLDKTTPKGDKPPKSEKSPAELAAEAREKAYNAEVDDIEHLAYMQDLNADEQIILWKKLSKNHAQYLKENEEAREDYDKQIKDLNKQSVEDSFNASKSFIEERKSLNQMSLSEEYDAWNRVQKKYKKDSKEWIEIEKEKYRVKKDLTQKLIDKAKELSDKEKDLDNDILSKQKEIRDHVSDMASEIIDIYKDVYETQKKILDAELSKYEEIYDARMKLIDDEEASEDYKRNLLKLQDEQMEIQKDLNVSILNDDVSNKKRREELEKALAEKTNEINDLKHDHEIDLRKESLQNDLDTKKKEVEAEKNHLDELINNDKKFAQIRQEVMSGVFTNVLADFAKFKVDIGEKSALIGESLSTNITDKISNMETQIATSSTLLQGIFAQLGIALEETFVKTLKDLITELEKLNGLKFDNFNQQIANTAEILALMKQNSADWIATTDKATRAQLAADTKVLGESIGLNIGKDGVWRDSTGASAYNQTAKQIVTNNDIVSQMKENSSAWSTASPEEQKKLADANQKLGEAQGWTRGADGIWRDKSGKKVYHTGGTVGGSSTPIGEALHSAFNLNKNEEMAKLLKKEVVINPANFKPRNFVQDMLGSIKMPNFSGFNPAVAGGGNVTNNLNINIENMSGSQKDVDSLSNKIVTGLHKMGVKI